MIYNWIKIRDTPENYREILKIEQLWTTQLYSQEKYGKWTQHINVQV